MLDDIIELILELIIDGMVTATQAKKVPLPIRIGLGALLSILVLGLIVLLLFVGIKTGSTVLIVLSAVLWAATLIWIVAKVKTHKTQH